MVVDRWTYWRDPLVADAATVDLERCQVRDMTPAGYDEPIKPDRHRQDVIRRLLELDVSARCLRALLPEWSTLILAVADSLEREHAERSDATDVLPL